MVDGLVRAGIAGASLLEIGCGVGALHQRLLEQGAARAVGVDLAQPVLDEARAWAGERGLAARVDYRLGDFVDIHAKLPAADVVLLDKVICCYPDAETLVARSLAKAGRLYAYTLPRDRWATRVGVAITGLGLWLLRSAFRTYVHDPARVAAWVTAAGFKPVYLKCTFLWRTEVFRRT